MERILWKNRHVIETKQAAIAVSAVGGTCSSSTVSLAADMRSIRAGIPTRATIARPEDLEREMQQALEPQQSSVEEPWARHHDVVRHGNEEDTALQIATSDAKARWNHAFEWQKRVSALLAPAASREDKLASVVQIAVQPRIGERKLTRPLPREPTTRGERSVSFSANTITAQARTSTRLLATQRPHPPARAREAVGGTGVEAGRTAHNRVATMLSGAEVTSEDEARIRAKIDRAKRALEAKKKMQAAKVLGALSHSSKSP